MNTNFLHDHMLFIHGRGQITKIKEIQMSRFFFLRWYPSITLLSFLGQAAGNEAFHAGQYTEALEHYSAAIACSKESCLFTAVCLCNHAATYQALGQIVDAIADCSLAIALDPTYTKVFNLKLWFLNILIWLDCLNRLLFFYFFYF